VQAPSLPYRDRRAAGRYLASQLRAYADRPDVIALALPRGGVPVAYEVARALHCPLDVFVVRKLGAPGNEELAMGAIASGGVRVFNDGVLAQLRHPEAAIAAAVERETRELERREQSYRGSRPPPELDGRTAILVDDGLATGATMRAAIAALRRRPINACVVAVPIAAPDTRDQLRGMAEEIVCAQTSEPFYGLSSFYEDFSQTSDAEVHELLERTSSIGEPKAGD